MIDFEDTKYKLFYFGDDMGFFGTLIRQACIDKVLSVAKINYHHSESILW